MLRPTITLALLALPTMATANGLAEQATRSLSACVAVYESACAASAADPQACLMTGVETCQRVHSGAVGEVTDAMLQIREISRNGGHVYRTGLTMPGSRPAGGDGAPQRRDVADVEVVTESLGGSLGEIGNGGFEMSSEPVGSLGN